MGMRRDHLGAPEATNIRLVYAKGLKLIPTSNTELIHLYTKKLNISLKKCKQALVTKRDVMGFRKHTATHAHTHISLTAFFPGEPG